MLIPSGEYVIDYQYPWIPDNKFTIGLSILLHPRNKFVRGLVIYATFAGKLRYPINLQRGILSHI